MKKLESKKTDRLYAFSCGCEPHVPISRGRGQKLLCSNCQDKDRHLLYIIKECETVGCNVIMKLDKHSGNKKVCDECLEKRYRITLDKVNEKNRMKRKEKREKREKALKAKPKSTKPKIKKAKSEYTTLACALDSISDELNKKLSII